MDLLQKAAELGIQTDFHDGQGHRHTPDMAALKIILDAMPVRAPHRLLKGPVVARAGEESRTDLTGDPSFPVTWSIRDGEQVVGQGIAGQPSIVWPADLPIGSYQLHLSDASLRGEDAPFISAPPKAFAGDFERAWLLAVQLYGVRSGRNWGIGDFTDLANLIELFAALGADGIGLNPLHALFDDRPADCSPYAPNSRLFLNPLYIDIERLLPQASHRPPDAAIARLREGDTVDYVGVAAVKWPALRAAFEQFAASSDAERHADFEEFRKRQGPLLARFACFEVLRHQFNRPWWDWPSEYRQPDDARCVQMREGEHAREIAFVEFVQWCADQQLGECQQLATRLGMRVGLYLDVAVGVQTDGFDAWNEQTAISRHLSVGAPPDQLNSAGQNWGLAGFNAAGLEVTAFVPFRDMLRAAMRHAGAIRLDHVLGLKRLYLVPHGFAASNGVYVQMPFEALLAVTAQESIANHCVVIGEDLGTVPEGFGAELSKWGIWSYRVMMFERDYHSGAFHGADDYLPDALVTFNTHDLATFAGWRSAADLRFKRSVGLDPGESDDARRHAHVMLRDQLRRHAIDQDDFYAVMKFLARTPSRLLAVALEDLLGVVDQPNIPGTVDQHPNWRRRLPVAIDAILAVLNRDALREGLAPRSHRR